MFYFQNQKKKTKHTQRNQNINNQDNYLVINEKTHKNGIIKKTYELCTAAPTQGDGMNVEMNTFEAQFPCSSDEDSGAQLCPAVDRTSAKKDLATTALPAPCASTWDMITVGLMVCQREVSLQDIPCAFLYLGFFRLYRFFHPSFLPPLLTCATETQQERETWDHQALGQASWSSWAGC